MPPAVGLGLWKRRDSKIQAEWRSSGPATWLQTDLRPLEALRPLCECTPRSPGPVQHPLLHPGARVASWVLRMEAKGRWSLPRGPSSETLCSYPGPLSRAECAAVFHHESVTRGQGSCH